VGREVTSITGRFRPGEADMDGEVFVDPVVDALRGLEPSAIQ